VCPAGWQKGKAGMSASPEGVAKYLAEHGKEL
jgi:peroxiredoxin (alkyl hydroperoxide reductase subunit C)